MLALAGLVFICYRLYHQGISFNFSYFTLKTECILIFLVIVYALANILLASAWRNVLKQFGTSISSALAIKIYGISQLAKYVPGNIFHLAGRQTMGMAQGLSSWALAKSIFWELALLVMASCFFSLLALPLKWQNISIPITLITFSLASISVITILHRSRYTDSGAALTKQIIFLLISATIFSIILSTINSSVDISIFPILCGGYVLAWLMGLVMPGSPAGMGVREIAIIFLLKGLGAEKDLLLAAVLGRTVTLLGDLLFFISVFFMRQGEKCE